MAKTIKFTIDGKEYTSQEGKYIVDAARENNVYIPTLCNIVGVHPQGSCRLCTVKVNGRHMTACTTPLTDGMQIENNSKEIADIRKAIIEMLFVEGNHFCPSCEKSGRCDLQAMAYRFQMMVPEFPYMFPNREVEVLSDKLLLDSNRCILCKRCIRGIKDKNGNSIFTFKKRANKVRIAFAKEAGEKMSDKQAQEAMDICPVGAIIRKEQGFNIPIGNRKYDNVPIGSEIEKNLN